MPRKKPSAESMRRTRSSSPRKIKIVEQLSTTVNIGAKRNISEVMQTFETEVRPNKRVRNDHDKYCFICHKLGQELVCSSCSRSFHERCLSSSKVFDDNDECFQCQQVRSEREDFSSTPFPRLSKYLMALVSNSLPLKHRVPFMAWPTEVNNEKLCFVTDGARIIDKCQNYANYSIDDHYSCPQDLLGDLMWILHNCAIIYGDASKEVKIMKNVIKKFQLELNDSDDCLECYLFKNKEDKVIGETNEFLHLCSPPHPIVWAKVKGYPYWPAKLLRVVNGYAHVRFFYTHQFSSVKDVLCISKTYPSIKGLKEPITLKYQTAKEELAQYTKVFVSKYKIKEFPYAEKNDQVFDYEKGLAKMLEIHNKLFVKEPKKTSSERRKNLKEKHSQTNSQANLVDLTREAIIKIKPSPPSPEEYETSFENMETEEDENSHAEDSSITYNGRLLPGNNYLPTVSSEPQFSGTNILVQNVMYGSELNLFGKQSDLSPSETTNPIIIKAIFEAQEQNNAVDSHNAVDSQNNAVDSQNNAVDSQNNAVDSQNNAVDSQNNAVDSQNNAADSQNNAADSQNNAADSQINAVNSQINAVNSQINAVNSQNNAVNSQNNAVYSQNNAVYSQNNAVYSQNNAVNSQNNAVNSQNNEIDSITSNSALPDVSIVHESSNCQPCSTVNVIEENNFSNDGDDDDVIDLTDAENKKRLMNDAALALIAEADPVSKTIVHQGVNILKDLLVQFWVQGCSTSNSLSGTNKDFKILTLKAEVKLLREENDKLKTELKDTKQNGDFLFKFLKNNIYLAQMKRILELTGGKKYVQPKPRNLVHQSRARNLVFRPKDKFQVHQPIQVLQPKDKFQVHQPKAKYQKKTDDQINQAKGNNQVEQTEATYQVEQAETNNQIDQEKGNNQVDQPEDNYQVVYKSVEVQTDIDYEIMTTITGNYEEAINKAKFYAYCTLCFRPASITCCFNNSWHTDYCSELCQEKHREEHLLVCEKVKKKKEKRRQPGCSECTTQVISGNKTVSSTFEQKVVIEQVVSSYNPQLNECRISEDPGGNILACSSQTVSIAAETIVSEESELTREKIIK